MRMECTDCMHCANFVDGYRIWCAHPELPGIEIYKYEPLGDLDPAEWCNQFDEDMCHHFSWDQLIEAEAHAESFDDFEIGIRDWIDKQLGSPADV